MLQILAAIYSFTWLTIDLIPTLLWAAAITATGWTVAEAIGLHLLLARPAGFLAAHHG